MNTDILGFCSCIGKERVTIAGNPKCQETDSVISVQSSLKFFNIRVFASQCTCVIKSASSMVRHQCVRLRFAFHKVKTEITKERHQLGYCTKYRTCMYSCRYI